MKEAIKKFYSIHKKIIMFNLSAIVAMSVLAALPYDALGTIPADYFVQIAAKFVG